MSTYLGRSKSQEGVVEEFLEQPIRRTGAGCDVHRDTIHVHHVRFTQHNTVIRLSCKFSNTHTGIDRCCEWVTQLKTDFGCELFVIESTGTYHKPLIKRLRAIVPCCVVNPSEFRKYGKKADKFDAKKLAQLSLQDLFTETYVSSPIHEELQQLSRAVRKMTTQIVANSNSIGSFLTANDILLTHSKKGIKVLSASGRAILTSIISGESDPVSCATCARYYAESEDASRMERFTYLVEALRGIQTMPASSRLILREKYHTILLLEQKRAVLKLALYKAMKTDTRSYPDGRVLNGVQLLDLLMTQPHVGEVLGTTIIAECGVELERRFGPMTDKYAPVRMSAYAGLNPRKQYSADKQSSRRKGIAGNKFLRSVAIEAGQSALKSTMSKTDDPVGYWAKQLAARNGGQQNRDAYNSAAAAAARRMIEASYWIICKGEPYNPGKYDFDRINRNTTHKNQKTVRYILRKAEEGERDLNRHTGKTDVKADVNAIIMTLKKAIGEEHLYQLSPFAKDQAITANSFGKRIKTVLEKHGIVRYSHLWFCIQQNTLKNLKGLGEKMYAMIIQGLLDDQFLKLGHCS
jgi:transposase